MNRSDYKEYLLPTSADDYIRGELKDAKTLGRMLLREKDVSNSKKVTYLAENVRSDLVVDYEGGPLKGTEGSLRWLAKKIGGFLSCEENHLVLMQDFLSCPSDPWIRRTGTGIHLFGEEIYYSLDSKTAQSSEEIEQKVRQAESVLLFIGIMTSLTQDRLPLKKELDGEGLLTLVQRTEHLFVRAYDGCGYILCSFR